MVMECRRLDLFAELRFAQRIRKKKLQTFSELKTLFSMLLVLMLMVEFSSLYLLKKTELLDTLNHASIIDGVRLSKAQRFRFKMPTWKI